MRILFDATSMALSGYHKAGAYRYLLELLRHLPAEAPPEWQLELYFNFIRGSHIPRMHEACREAGVERYKLCRIPPQLLRAVDAPIEWSAGRHDLFHGPFDVVPKSRHAARVTPIHDLAFLRAPEGLPQAWAEERARVVPPSAQRAHRIITVSEFSRRDIIEKLQIAPEKVRAIHHGILSGIAPTTDPDGDLLRLKERYGIRPGFLLYLGTLQPNKNIEGLCTAFQQLRARGFEGQLVLAGAKGWMYDEMMARIAARGDDAGVLLTGFVDEEDIPRMYGNCAAFALVSFLEGFGIPVIEAMASGAPVVAADACSLTEVTGDGGLLVDPHDVDAIAAALERAATAGTERDALIAAGLARAKQFTWSRSAAQHVEVYREAIEAAA